MNENLEQMLCRMPLHKPSAELDDRVLTTLREADDAEGGAVAPRWRLVIGWSAVGAALAACVALAALISLHAPAGNGLRAKSVAGLTPPDVSSHIVRGRASDADPLAAFNPVRIEQVWSDLEPQGVVLVNDTTPLRRYRHQVVEHVELIDKARNIRIEMTVPRDDVIVTPVRYD